MAVVCDTCKTHNRDNAMFCRGCAGKLPGFAATGPSALAALRAEPSAAASARPAAPPRPTRQAVRPIESPVFWIRLGLAIVMMAVGFVGWYMYVTRKAPPPPPGPVVAAIAVSASAPRGLPLTLLTPVEPVEFIDPPQPVQPATRLLPAPPPLPAAAPYTEPRRPVRTAAVAHTAVADPRSGCGHLNFIAAARCEAAQCDRPGYSQHPRCDVVRADRRRDEARRNPLMAY